MLHANILRYMEHDLSATYNKLCCLHDRKTLFITIKLKLKGNNMVLKQVSSYEYYSDRLQIDCFRYLGKNFNRKVRLYSGHTPHIEVKLG